MSADEGAPVAIRTEGLTRRFGDRTAVDGLDLSVAAGEFFGFLGPNGAGKYTTIRLLSGLLRPTSGRALIAGFDAARDPVEVKSRIGVLTEEGATYERLTGRELLVFTGRMHGLGRPESEKRAGDLLRLMDLRTDDAGRMLVDYSLGMRKKVLLACALIHRPQVLFLDEPFGGIDAVSAHALREVLRRLAERGVTIFFCSHVLEVVERLCSRLAIIHEGRLRAQGTVDEIRAATGHSPDAPLHDVFVDLVGGPADTGGLEWLD